jgi:hypothetical protein
MTIPVHDRAGDKSRSVEGTGFCAVTINVDNSNRATTLKMRPGRMSLQVMRFLLYFEEPAHSHGWEKEVDGLVSRGAGVIGIGWERDRGIFSQDTHQDFTISADICQ